MCAAIAMPTICTAAAVALGGVCVRPPESRIDETAKRAQGYAVDAQRAIGKNEL